MSAALSAASLLALVVQATAPTQLGTAVQAGQVSGVFGDVLCRR